jgi:hypothetical protein
LDKTSYGSQRTRVPTGKAADTRALFGTPE